MVRAGSARAWGRQETDDAQSFVRSSQQRLWLQPDERGLVLEQAYVDHHARAITLIGAAWLPGPDGTQLQADPRQALFHVEHSARGPAGRSSGGASSI